MDIGVEILHPEWNRSFEADAVWLPGTLGEFEVLRGHAPIISTLVAGKLKWRAAGKMEEMEINGGVMRLKDNRMKICVE